MYITRVLPTSDDILALSREEIASYILEHLNSEAQGHYHGEDNYSQNQSNYVRAIDEAYQNRDVTDRFAAAWRWLIERNLLAEDPKQVIGYGWYRLTTEGRRIKKHDQLQVPRIPRDANPGPVPNFHSLTTNAPLQKHLHVLWEEAALSFSGQAYLSTVIMLGSLLEGALLAKCLENDVAAKAAAHAPIQGGQVKPYGYWSLNDFIEVADDNHWTHKARNDFADTLRDYRNMVHPFNAHGRGYFVDRSMAAICWEVVKATLGDLGVQM